MGPLPCGDWGSGHCLCLSCFSSPPSSSPSPPPFQPLLPGSRELPLDTPWSCCLVLLVCVAFELLCPLLAGRLQGDFLKRKDAGPACGGSCRREQGLVQDPAGAVPADWLAALGPLERPGRQVTRRSSPERCALGETARVTEASPVVFPAVATHKDRLPSCAVR